MTKYQLSLRATKMKKGFLWQTPMPYAVVSVENDKPSEPQVLGTTEKCEATLSPDWCKCIEMELTPEDVLQRVPFVVVIYDGKDDRVMAKATFEASEVVALPGHMQRKEDPNGTQIFVSLQKSIQGTAQGYIRLHLRGLDIKNVEPGLLGLGRSDPFFEIAKKNSDAASGIVAWNTIYRSEYVQDHLNPYWEPFNIGLEELCYCNLEWPLKISVWDWEASGKHRRIGEFEVTTQKLMDRIAIRGNADREQAFDLVLDEKAQLKGLVCSLTAELTLLEDDQ